MDAIWSPNPSLAGASRWWSWHSATGIADRPAALFDVFILIALGLVAAIATSAAGLGIPLPGHAILRGTLPLMLGLSLVPRHGAGSAMSVTAAISLTLFRLGGWGPLNVAAVAGLISLGPALDFALAQARPGWQLYLRAAAAGLLANLLAFSARLATAALLGEAQGGGHGFLSFWPVALVSFAIFGLLAGLISGATWFRARPRGEFSP